MDGNTITRFVLDEVIQLVPCANSVDAKDVYRIGDLAQDFNVTLRTLRFYEDRGLISPQRSGSTRLYSKQDRKRVKIILFAKRVGFSLVDIQHLLDMYDSTAKGDAHKLLILEKFSSQLENLKSQKLDVEQSIEDLARVIQSIKDL